ncbi:unnamed protein product [Closterium sp. Naga37s-1]|nr:unnamed protein product [Closterium sp. Naga37s-1]
MLALRRLIATRGSSAAAVVVSKQLREAYREFRNGSDAFWQEIASRSKDTGASPDRHLVVTASGPDRLGIVSTLAKRILECGGNVEESRMARLAGDFSIIMLIRVDATSPRIAEDLRLKLLEVQGLQVSTRWTVDERSDETAPKRKFRRLVLRGADNPGLGLYDPGLVYNVTEYLSSKNINIENLETFTEEAPFGGTMLFLMEGVIAMPIRLPTRQLERQLDALEQSLGVQIELLNLDPKDMVEDWRVWQQTMARNWGLPKYSSLAAAKPPPFHV